MIEVGANASEWEHVSEASRARALEPESST